MADIKEFKTWPTSHLLFYKVTNNAVTFRVKAALNAVVGLSRQPCLNNHYEVIIRPHSCCIKSDPRQNNIRMQNLLSGGEFKEFWLTWRNNTIIFGQGSTMILSLSNTRAENYKYVSFSVNEDRTSATWQVFLPPAIEQLPLKELEGGEPRWVNVDHQLPDDSVIGGFEKEFLYIMRAKHRGSLTPGKFVPSLGTGVIAWGGEAHFYDDIEVLCGHNHWWVSCKNGQVPVGAVCAGYSEDRNELLYVGRAWYKHHLIVGKVQPSHRVCYIPFNGKEIAQECYEVLVAPSDRRELMGNDNEYNSDSNRSNSDDE